MGSQGRLSRFFRLKSTAIVYNSHYERGIAEYQTNEDSTRSGVFADIGEALLNQTIEGDFIFRRYFSLGS